MKVTENPRHPKGILTAFGAVGTHLRCPWVTAWWSAALPGFGHLFIASHLKGYILIVWEFLVNTQSHLNTAILFAFTGRFQEAREVVDHRWLLLYGAVYIYTIWDSYSETIELNKYYVLAEREDYPISPIKMNVLAVGYGKKRKPWLAIMWSLLTPGLGHLYVNKLMEGITIMAWAIGIAYMSHLAEAVRFSFVGDFVNAKAIVNYEWLLFFPSLYVYSAYGSYAGVVELNKFYDAEQARYLKQTYTDAEFIMPF